jgi:hypothetical protein
MEVNGQLHVLVALLQGNNPNTQSTKGWVDNRDGPGL